jgi:hypothetical protein
MRSGTSHGKRSAKQQGNQKETGYDAEGKKGREEGQEEVTRFRRVSWK